MPLWQKMNGHWHKASLRRILSAPMSCYKIFDRRVASNLAFPGLQSLPGEVADVEFRVAPASDVLSQPIVWLTSSESDEWALFGKCGSEFLVRFPDLADFLISADWRLISCHPAPETSAETISHLFLDQVFPCLLGKAEAIVLHASAVAFSSGTAVFIGESGQGKSTLSASLSANGLPLLADDSVMVKQRENRLVCEPSYPGIRLWPESVAAVLGEHAQGSPMAQYSEKQRFTRENSLLAFAEGELPLRKLYLLADAEESVGIAPVNPREAYLEILKHIYRLGFSDWQRFKEECDFVANLVETVMPCRLSFPRAYEFLPEVRRALLSDLNSGVTR